MPSLTGRKSIDNMGMPDIDAEAAGILIGNGIDPARSLAGGISDRRNESS